MACSSYQSTFSLSRFLSLETVAEDDADEDEVNEYQSPIQREQHVRVLLEMENDRTHVQSHVDDWIITARSEAIQWIINTRSFLRLRFHTAYLSVMYIDQFMSKGLISRDKHWAIRLLPVACLSLAAKMEERKTQPLSAFSIGEYNFDSNQIQRMELLVLSTLNWRIHYITPFHFIQSFISCFFVEDKKHFISLITQILFAATKDMSIMRYPSSTIALAATLTVLDQNLTKESLEIKLKTTWLNLLLNHEDVYTCYSRVLKLEPVKVNISKPDLVNNPSIGTKRKRLTFGEEEEKPSQ